MIAALGDTHIGSTVALCPPLVELDDGGEYKASPLQRLIWYHAWLPFVGKVTSAPPGLLVLNGDLVDVDAHRRSHQFFSRNLNDITRTALDVFAPLVTWAARIVFVRGTAAHTGLASEAEEALAAAVEARYPGKVVPAGKKVYTHAHITLEHDGVHYDIAHHPEATPGRAVTGQATYGARLALAVWLRYAKARIDPPHRIIRGHSHQHGTGCWLNTTAYALPAWQWPTEYAYRIGAAEVQAAFGGLIGDTLDIYQVQRAKKLWQKI